MTGFDLSRRNLLRAGAGALAAGAVSSVAGASPAAAAAPSITPPGASQAVVPFYGRHQSGITTEAQQSVSFAAFDLTTTSRKELVALLTEWTAAAETMSRGKLIGETEDLTSAPDDTGEALDLPPSKLTVTVGFGPGMFDGRFGLAGRKPAVLQDLPDFPHETLVPGLSGGDLCIQACADDVQVAGHAVRNLARIAQGRASLKWAQTGYARASRVPKTQPTPRNLFGFKDGSRNLDVTDAAETSTHLWVGGEDQAWLAGGTYLVARRIRMMLETWDATALHEQEDTFGRHRTTGAPYGGAKEMDRVDMARQPETSHVRLAHPDTNGGAKMLRRGYNFNDGLDPQVGEDGQLNQIDAGLFFLAFVRDPATQFIPVQMRLAEHDHLNEYVQAQSSALFACPAGVRGAGDFWGSALFA